MLWHQVILVFTLGAVLGAGATTLTVMNGRNPK